MRDKKRIRGGRAPIRTVLYMAMMSAIQHNLIIKRFYHSLVNAGKHKKVALTAGMGKIVSILIFPTKSRYRSIVLEAKPKRKSGLAPIDFVGLAVMERPTMRVVLQ